MLDSAESSWSSTVDCWCCLQNDNFGIYNWPTFSSLALPLSFTLFAKHSHRLSSTKKTIQEQYREEKDDTKEQTKVRRWLGLVWLAGWLTWHTQSVSILCQRASVCVYVVGCPNGGRMLWDRSCFGMADWMESIGCKIIMMMIIFSGFRLAFSPFEHQSKPKVVRRGGGVHLPRQYTLDAQFNLSLFSLYFHHHHHHHDHDCQEQQRQQPTGQSVSPTQKQQQQTEMV